MDIQIGLQLYSIRDEIEKDFKGTIEKVANIGYKGVEFAGFYGVDAKEVKSMLDSLKLVPCGSHEAMDGLKNNLDYVIEYNKTIGNKYIICPWAEYKSKQDFVDMAKLLNKIGKKCKDNDIVFGYHNHAHEFVSFGEETGMDILINETDPNLVTFELDTYWVKYAGIDPAEFIKKYSGRFKLIHIKDMEIIDNKMQSTEIGNGIMDFKTLSKAAADNGTLWFIVEQEAFRGSTIESVAKSIENINKDNLIWRG
jgi:sugar phosphate isomerase/epimerase